jgi:hypothetical protein
VKLAVCLWWVGAIAWIFLGYLAVLS